MGRRPKGKSRNSPLMDSDALCSSDRTMSGSSGAFSKVAAATKLVESETWPGNPRRCAGGANLHELDIIGSNDP